ncbi:MAG: hypothetical protein QX188_05880, partial [Methylococcaceae bacterium]
MIIVSLNRTILDMPDNICLMRLLNRIITRDVARCRVGQVFYTPWCDAAGKVLDDGTLQRLGDTDFR